ncbi:hypothetical protein [Winogradskyella pulchriflava]|uniref:DUF2846 domain-containing protein n=1 Tax=Winogradskyella pulchriflava TaxID=1110688 RepID=A0ABV6Q529_9FLAO
MIKLKKAIYAIVFATVFSLNFQCASSKVAEPTFEAQAPFLVKPASFQEWYAGIKVGGTGINIFLPIYKVTENIEFKNVYFRNLKGELTWKEGKYVAILKNPSKSYTFRVAEKPADYPFDLMDNECAISYIENGQTKYYKISALKEVAGTYYENGPPSIYARNSSERMASLDEEEDDN